MKDDPTSTEPAVFQPRFTQPEAQRLLELLDLAVRHAGLQVASDALVITQRIQQSKVVPLPPGVAVDAK